MKWRPGRRTLLLGAVLLSVSILIAPGCLWPGRPETLGVHEGRLRDCPSSPNCVSSARSAGGEDGEESRESSPADSGAVMPPISFTGSVARAVDTLVDVVNGMPRSKIITRTPRYLHVEFRSAVFRFVDDVEFLIDDRTRSIHFRSASRAGYSDLGVNHRRMEAISRATRARLDQGDAGGRRS